MTILTENKRFRVAVMKNMLKDGMCYVFHLCISLLFTQPRKYCWLAISEKERIGLIAIVLTYL